jgi:hypothetical protein
MVRRTRLDGNPIACTATNRQGQPCQNPAREGSTVCRNHGGNAPQVRRKANLRLIELIDPAIGTLAREMVQAGKSNDRQAAANSILDRAGVPRKAEISSDDARALLLERLIQLRDENNL